MNTNQRPNNTNNLGPEGPILALLFVSLVAFGEMGPTIVGVRSGTVLDPELVAELRAVAARIDVAQRVLTILEPVQAPTSPAAAGRHGR